MPFIKLNRSVQNIFTKLEEILALSSKMMTATSKYISKKNPSTINSIRKMETNLNELEKQLEATCIQVIATGKPVAITLRRILMTLKMNSELERIGDLCDGITSAAERFYTLEGKSSIPSVKKLTSKTEEQLKRTFNSIKKRDQKEAREIRKMDRAINDERSLVITKVLKNMQNDPKKGFSGYEELLIALKLERIGDLCKNLAEEIIYSEKGDDIKHQK